MFISKVLPQVPLTTRASIVIIKTALKTENFEDVPWPFTCVSRCDMPCDNLFWEVHNICNSKMARKLSRKQRGLFRCSFYRCV